MILEVFCAIRISRLKREEVGKMKEFEPKVSLRKLDQELMVGREPRIELLGPIMEKFNKYGPLSEPSFRRPG